MSFAVIETGGKQYTVSEGDTIKIEKIKGDYSPGDEIIFDKVLLFDDGEDTEIGDPYLEKEVAAELVERGRGKKVEVVRFKPKTRHHKKRGHRQPYMKVTITKV